MTKMFPAVYIKYLHMSWIQTLAKPSIVNTNNDSSTLSDLHCVDTLEPEVTFNSSSYVATSIL